MYLFYNINFIFSLIILILSLITLTFFINNYCTKYIKMGRKAKFDETNVSSGHGKKAKKQGDPTFPKGILGMENYKFINMY